MLLFKYLYILLFLLWITSSQSTPESVEITDLPDQTQKIYQGWLCVSEKDQSYLYYQLFLADKAKDPSKLPLLLFLEGGPGDSSLQTVWADFGPYRIDSNLNFTGPNDPSAIRFTLHKRTTTWSNGSYNLLSIDNPTLTGFSYSKTKTIINDTIGAGAHLINFLTRFYEIYNNLATSPLYVIGHSYGGHYAPYLVYTLVKDYNKILGKIKVNLGGVIGLNPYVSLGRQTGYPSYFFASSLTDPNKRDYLEKIDYQIIQNIRSKKPNEAVQKFLEELRHITNSFPGILITPNATIDNVRRSHLLTNPDSEELARHYLSPKYFFNTAIEGVNSAKKMFNIPDDISFLNGYVEQSFIDSGDFGMDFAYTIEYLLEQGVDVTLLSAQDDGVIPVPGVSKLVTSLKWTGDEDYKKAERKPWRASNGTVVGNYKKQKNFNYVILYKAGHVATFDQPEALMNFLYRVTSNIWNEKGFEESDGSRKAIKF